MTEQPTTAAQPLDVDKLEALAKAARDDIIRSHGWAGTVDGFDALRVDEQYLLAANPATILALIAQARAALPHCHWKDCPHGAECEHATRPVQAGEAVDMDAERERFEEYKEGRYAGTQHDVIGWYYFDEDVNDQWSAWQARATLAPVGAQQAVAEEPITPEDREAFRIGVEVGRAQEAEAVRAQQAAAKAPAAQAVDARQALLFAARVVELYDDATLSQDDYMIDSKDCAAILTALADYVASPASTPEASQQAAAVAAPTYWTAQRKMIERAIIGLRDGWATRKDADDALATLAAAPTAVEVKTSEDSRDYTMLTAFHEKMPPGGLSKIGHDNILLALRAAMRATQQEGE